MTTSEHALPGNALTRRPLDREIDAFGLTHRGNVRADNQDHFLIAALQKRVHVQSTSLPGVDRNTFGSGRMAAVMMVADGVGGGDAGETASRLTVEAVMRYVSDSMQCYYTNAMSTEEAFASELEKAAVQCHLAVRHEAEEAGIDGMATTLTLWLGVWPYVYLLQIGDSRYYRYRDGTLDQISRDQTMAEELVDQGILTREDAARSKFSHVLSSSIGGRHAEPAPRVTRLRNDWDSVHLLCSDGLTRHVSDDRIRERIATMTSAQQLCETLVQDALDGGGADNVTVCVGRAVRDVTADEPPPP